MIVVESLGYILANTYKLYAILHSLCVNAVVFVELLFTSCLVSLFSRNAVVINHCVAKCVCGEGGRGRDINLQMLITCVPKVLKKNMSSFKLKSCEVCQGNEKGNSCACKIGW